MKSHRFAAAALAALFSLAACAENPVAPTSDASYTVISQSFARGAAKPYTFTRFDVPGAFQTVASGINAGGVIVGWYFQGTGCPNAPCVVKGFIFEDGAFTTIVYHNDVTGTDAAVTQLRGIGPSGEIVGSYRMAGEPTVNFHGFILTTGGEFVSVDYPGHTNTVPQRILPDGTILGCYHDNDQMGSMHGMLSDKDGFSAIGQTASMHNGATPSLHRITGLFTDGTGKGRAYVIEGGVFTPFDAPNSVFTAAWDMSPSGTIVGLFADAASHTHGFVLERGQFTTIDYPGSTYTDIFGINASGDLVGKYRETASGPFHGYVATPN
ncbi:MAG: hypothetical protein M3P26_11305 [Gemmatimonadota bacterium]|nr:hypothetical protein [Gemmatimonadota bacterium]